MNRNGGRWSKKRRLRADSITSRTSLTPEVTAERVKKGRSSCEATIFASVVCPRPGTPEDKRGDVARLEELAEDAVRAHEVLLSDVFVDGFGAQAFRQRGIGHGLEDFLRRKDSENSLS